VRSDSHFQISLKKYNITEELSPLSPNFNQIQPTHKEITPIWQIISLLYSKYRLSGGLDIEIWCDIPSGVGLGSSAAVSVATTAALNNLFDLNLGASAISSIAFEGEKITHGTPSGIDNTISSYGGAILFKKGRTQRIEIPLEIPLLIVNSGISRETKTQVNHVRSVYETYPTIFTHVFNAIDGISLKVEHVLRLKNLKILGELMNYNHEFLRILGVSTKELDSLIEYIKLTGAIGAKLTGAGGGGCIIALFDSIASKNNCISQLKSRKIEYFDTKISEFGFQIHETTK